MKEFYEWKQGKIELPHKSVLITFDDGFLSNYHYAFPLLKKYNMNATVFLIGEYVQNTTQTDWNGNIKTYMPLELVEKSKEEYPNIDFCSHTYGLHYHNSINEVSKEQKIEWLDKFYRRMSTALYKWSILPPSVIVDSRSINKYDYKQPITSSRINYKGLSAEEIQNKIEEILK